MTITRILVANRGEIARRVFTTARRLGIATVAVYSDADAGLPFVSEADLAVRLPGNTPAETYLRADLIIDAAKKTGADAIHPGYGFLSENAEFARAVVAAGLIWIGPTPESIDAMGSKIAAKKLMADAGVPVFGEIDPAAATAADLPLLVKASAGGGGRGMRIVRDLDELAGQVKLASDEAASAFGDPTVFCEPYLEKGRHVEVQVVGDTHGNVVILGERDCSLQRRHQKVVEEAPAFGLSDKVRQTLHEGARLAAQAIGYVGAGTVEFMVSTSSTNGKAKVSFLEMNTRLQVEHPVTEAVFGIDLVEAQIRVAEGEDLSQRPAVPSAPRGHAVEVRLYAEDPAADYQPQSGRLDTFEIDCETEFLPFLTYGSRLDSGFVSGSEVSTHYDAMLAKVIVWGPTREAAFRTLAGILERARIHGLVTNRDLLVRLLRDDQVLAGEISTDFLGTFDLVGTAADNTAAAQAAALALAERDRAARTVQHAIPVAWRNVVSQPQRTVLAPFGGGEDLSVEWYGGRTGYWFPDGPQVVAASPEQVVLEVDGVRVTYRVVLADGAVHVDSGRGSASFREVPRFIDPADQVSAGSLLAPMPGTVIAVPAEHGAQVEAGQTLLVLEAMKMQHSISAPGDGIVEIAVQVGQQVAAGDVLAVVTASDDTSVEEGDTA